jgi:hypothetical protein
MAVIAVCLSGDDARGAIDPAQSHLDCIHSPLD